MYLLMPRKKVERPYVPKPGYSFADLLVLTDATKSNLTHWTNTGVVKAALEETSGSGHHRRFSALNVIETEVAFVVNKHRVPVETLREALDTFRSFHRKAVAIYDEFASAPLNPEHIALFPTLEARHNVAMGYLSELGTAFKDKKRAGAHARALADAWHFVRTGPYIKGMGDASWHHFIGLFIAKEADSNYQDIVEVILDPTAEDLHYAVGRTAIVVELGDVVFRVGEHCKRLGGIPLDRW